MPKGKASKYYKEKKLTDYFKEHQGLGDYDTDGRGKTNVIYGSDSKGNFSYADKGTGIRNETSAEEMGINSETELYHGSLGMVTIGNVDDRGMIKEISPSNTGDGSMSINRGSTGDRPWMWTRRMTNKGKPLKQYIGKAKINKGGRQYESAGLYEMEEQGINKEGKRWRKERWFESFKGRNPVHRPGQSIEQLEAGQHRLWEEAIKTGDFGRFGFTEVVNHRGRGVSGWEKESKQKYLENWGTKRGYRKAGTVDRVMDFVKGYR